MEATEYIVNLWFQGSKDSTFWRLVNRLWPHGCRYGYLSMAEYHISRRQVPKEPPSVQAVLAKPVCTELLDAVC